MLSLDLPLSRRPRWWRPEGWAPRFGERVLYLRGDGHPVRTVRVGCGVLGGDRYPIAFDRFIGAAHLWRLCPLRGWEADRERFAREHADEETDQTAARSDDAPF